MSKLTLPGLIDIHVHLRDPGQTHKEDFYTGTSSALAGGFTTILDMPNNISAITSSSLLRKKTRTARKKVVCDIGFYFGSVGIPLPADRLVFGLKLFLNPTTGNLLIGEKELAEIFACWDSDLPILIHAENEKVALVIGMVKKTGKKTHICHISSKEEFSYVIKAKENGLPVTCGVTPHHLFLTERDVEKLKAFAQMKPTLKTKKDQEFLWKNLKYIDVIESDHAPHTVEEKQARTPPFGVPGLETTLPLLLQAESEGRLTMDQILDLCHNNPSKLFRIKTDRRTRIEINLKKFTIENKTLKTKCGWSPFAGWRVKGKVERVYIRGKKVFENEVVLVKPGFGRIITPTKKLDNN